MAVPENYVGEQIRTYGVILIEFEGSSLYVDRESYDRCIIINSLELSFIDNTIDSLTLEFINNSKSNGSGYWIAIEGVIRESSCDDYYIADISRIDYLPNQILE